MTNRDQDDRPTDNQPPKGLAGEVRRDGGPRESNVSEQDRDSHPSRGDDRHHPGSEASAGPHAQPSLTNEDATPGAGTLPDAGNSRKQDDIDADAATG